MARLENVTTLVQTFASAPTLPLPKDTTVQHAQAPAYVPPSEQLVETVVDLSDADGFLEHPAVELEPSY